MSSRHKATGVKLKADRCESQTKDFIIFTNEF